MHKTLIVEERDEVLYVTLNRPDVHNAFNDELIAEAIDVFRDAAKRGPRAIVMRGEGPSFCAGADLNWMSRMVGYTRDENVRDASHLATMFAAINECSAPVIGRIHGAAIGGGVGLVAVCDIAIASTDAKFGLSEVKLGIMPAVISPYVVAKIGATHARALFLTGERFDAERALRIGLVHRVVDNERSLDRAIDDTVAQIRSSGPEAVRETKKLIEHVASHAMLDAVPYTIEAIATRRVSKEGQAGMNAFLKKEKPPWSQK
jgi:methylglutaconyl-CoA hydratase